MKSETLNTKRKEKGFNPVKKKVRGFEWVSRLPAVAKCPTRGSVHSAGYDICAIEDYVIRPNQSVFIHTGVKAYMPPDEYLDLRVRSSLGIKRQLMLATGASVIDADYYNNPDNEGEIIVVLYNYGDETQTISAGERIVQGVFMPFLIVDGDEADGVRTGGFGSTGK